MTNETLNEYAQRRLEDAGYTIIPPVRWKAPVTVEQVFNKVRQYLSPEARAFHDYLGGAHRAVGLYDDDKDFAEGYDRAVVDISTEYLKIWENHPELKND